MFGADQLEAGGCLLCSIVSHTKLLIYIYILCGLENIHNCIYLNCANTSVLVLCHICLFSCLCSFLVMFIDIVVSVPSSVVNLKLQILLSWHEVHKCG